MTDLSPVYTKCRTPSAPVPLHMNSPARRIQDHGLQCLRLDSKLTPFLLHPFGDSNKSIEIGV
jgi:hypothetical protein